MSVVSTVTSACRECENENVDVAWQNCVERFFIGAIALPRIGLPRMLLAGIGSTLAISARLAKAIRLDLLTLSRIHQ
jgi:hypothetical protein